MNEKRFCNVPDCNNVHLARGLCNKHYCIWKNITPDFDYVERYVENKTTPIKKFKCTHDKIPENINILINGNGRKYKTCKLCKNIRDCANQKAARARRKKEE